MNRFWQILGWLGTQAVEVLTPLWITAKKGATIVALAGIHHYVVFGLNYFLGNDSGWIIFGKLIEFFTSGGFAIVAAYQVIEIVKAFVPLTWK